MNRYQTISQSKTEDGVRYLENSIYPDIPETADDIYVIATVGDRYDTLASQFYKDSSLWWIIASANPTSATDSIVATPGVQLRIPANHPSIISKYNDLNNKR
jgi:hypothetical protein